MPGSGGCCCVEPHLNPSVGRQARAAPVGVVAVDVEEDDGGVVARKVGGRVAANKLAQTRKPSGDVGSRVPHGQDGAGRGAVLLHLLQGAARDGGGKRGIVRKEGAFAAKPRPGDCKAAKPKMGLACRGPDAQAQVLRGGARGAGHGGARGARGKQERAARDWPAR